MKYLLAVFLISILSPSPVITFVGSTPADYSVRQSLKIPQTEKCDFIKWKLELNTPAIGQFKLDVNYGEGQPNTPGFWGGGHFSTFTGTFNTQKFNSGTDNRTFYQLTSQQFGAPLLLVKIDDNLLHILSPQKKVMIGTGGWSYTLIRSGENKLAGSNNNFNIEQDTARRIEYVGRTPCQEIAHQMKVVKSEDCKKAKWVIILKKDPITKAPAGFEMKGTFIRNNIDPKDNLKGVYSIMKGTKSHPEATVYKLDIQETNASIYLMNLDKSLLLFLNEKKELLPGNMDFRSTLNRKRE